MKTGKIKIVISALLIFVLVLSLVGCGNESKSEEPEENIVVEEGEKQVVPNADAYLWDRTNVEIDGKTYFDYLIEVNVEECYSYPTEDLVYMYDSGDETFKKMQDVNPDVKVETYCLNKDLGGSTEYFIRIRSPRLLDTKKISISYLGIKEFDASIDLNSDDLQTDDENFYSVIMGLTEPDSKSVGYRPFEIPNKLGEDFVVTKSDWLFYYFGSSEKMFIEDNTLWQKIDIDPINHGDLNELAESLKYLYFAEFSKDAKTNNDIESIFYDDKYEIKSKVEDGNVYIGVTTSDNSEIDESFRPDAFVILRGDFKFEENKLTNLEDCKELSTFFKINYGE